MQPFNRISGEPLSSAPKQPKRLPINVAQEKTGPPTVPARCDLLPATIVSSSRTPRKQSRSLITEGTSAAPALALGQPLTLTVRRPNWDFPHNNSFWFANNPFLTGLLNAYTLLVPDNEKYYIRVLSQCLPLLEDVDQISEVRQFCKQEAQHGIAHKKFWKHIPNLNFTLRYFLQPANFFLYRILESLQPLWLQLSIVAAIEHVNASWANLFLSGDLLAAADSEVAKLFRWHFAEEIEHKAVAHNVLQRLFPGRLKRCAGAVLAFPLFFFLVLSGALFMLLSDRRARSTNRWRDSASWLKRSGFIQKNLKFLVRYMRRDFNPWDLDDRELVSASLNSLP